MQLQASSIKNSFFAAVSKGDIYQIRDLISSVVSAKELVNQTDSDMQSPIFYLRTVNNQDLTIQILNILIQHGANLYHKEDNKQTVLSYFAKQGRAKVLQQLLTNYKFDLKDTDKYQQTPLYWAASYGRLKASQILLKYGVNINSLDQNGQTCLFYAARQGQLQMCKFLVNRGCQYDLVDRNKKTPLHFARQFKHHSVVQYLISLKEAKKIQKQSKQHSYSHQQQRDKKKKEAARSEYLLAFTNDQGVMTQVSAAELKTFSQKSELHLKLWDYFVHPQKLQGVETKNDRKAVFVKNATKLITNYLKRNDLQLFHEAVDTSKYLDYLDHIQRPMDFSTVKNKLNSNCYDNESEFKEDILLVYDNCIRYNGEDSPLGHIVKSLKMEFLEGFRKEFPL